MDIYENGTTGTLSWFHNGIEYEEKVVYAGFSKNRTGPAAPGHSGGTNEPSVWVINKHGSCSPLPLSLAKEFFAKPGQKYRFAKEDEVPMVPENKVYPLDSEKNHKAQVKATTSLTGSEVEEQYKKGEGIETSKATWAEIRKVAKANDIPTYARTRVDIEEELVSKKLI